MDFEPTLFETAKFLLSAAFIVVFYILWPVFLIAAFVLLNRSQNLSVRRFVFGSTMICVAAAMLELWVLLPIVESLRSTLGITPSLWIPALPLILKLGLAIFLLKKFLASCREPAKP